MKGKRLRACFRLLAAAVLLFSAFPLTAFGRKEVKPEQLTVRGLVRLVGSEPLTELVISGEEEWHIDREERPLLESYQQREITVQGEAVYEDLILANGKKIGVIRRLRHIEILDPCLFSLPALPSSMIE